MLGDDVQSTKEETNKEYDTTKECPDIIIFYYTS